MEVAVSERLPVAVLLGKDIPEMEAMRVVTHAQS